MAAPPPKVRIKVDGQDVNIEFTPNRHTEAALQEWMPSKFRRLYLTEEGSATLFGGDDIVGGTVELCNDMSQRHGDGSFRPRATSVSHGQRFKA